MRMNYVVQNIYYAYPVGWGCAAVSVMIYYLTVIRPRYTKLLEDQKAEGREV
jgi:hypothetical protein